MITGALVALVLVTQGLIYRAVTRTPRRGAVRVIVVDDGLAEALATASRLGVDGRLVFRARSPLRGGKFAYTFEIG